MKRTIASIAGICCAIYEQRRSQTKRTVITLCCAIIGAVNGAVFLGYITRVTFRLLDMPWRDPRGDDDFLAMILMVPSGLILGGATGAIVGLRRLPAEKYKAALGASSMSLLFLLFLITIEYEPISTLEFTSYVLYAFGPALFWSLLLFAWGIRCLWRARNTYSKRA